MLNLELKNGKSIGIIFGRDKANDELVKNLKKDTKKHNIKIHTYLFD